MSLTQTKKEYLGYILDGMARSLWVNAYANWADNVVSTCIHCDQQIELRGSRGWVDEESGSATCAARYVPDNGHEPDGESDDNGPAVPTSGGDWDAVAPATPYAAYLAAQALARLWALAEDSSLPDLFEAAMMIDKGEFEWLPPDEEVAAGDSATQADTAMEFGGGLAWESLGTGASWFDHHKQERDGARLEFATPRFECTYDGKDLHWSGATRGGKTHVTAGHQEAVYDADLGETTLTRLGRVTFINPNDDTWRHSYLIAVSHYGHVFFVRASDEGSALDEIADWLVENAPGILCDLSEEGFLSVGNGGHYLPASEVNVLATDPSREQLFEIARVGDDLRINPPHSSPCARDRRARADRRPQDQRRLT